MDHSSDFFRSVNIYENITKLNDFAITKTCNEFLFFVLIQGQVPCVKKYDYKKY